MSFAEKNNTYKFSLTKFISVVIMKAKQGKPQVTKYYKTDSSSDFRATIGFIFFNIATTNC